MVAVGVGHGMDVKVLVGDQGIGVTVGVEVMVGALVDVAVGTGVLVGVTVEVAVGVDVAVPVGVRVDVAVLVEVGVWVGIGVGVSAKFAGVGVSVTNHLVVLTTGVEVGVTVAVWVACTSGLWPGRFAKSATIIATTPPLPIRGTMTYRIHHLMPFSPLSPAILTPRDATLPDNENSLRLLTEYRASCYSILPSYFSERVFVSPP